MTHNMQQAARVSDRTAFMYLGELIEFDETDEDVYQSPTNRRRRTTSPGGSADASSSRGKHNGYRTYRQGI